MINLFEKVVKNDFCVGCGVCAGVCPQRCLEIRFCEKGLYLPYLAGQCSDCGLCLSVCPHGVVDAGEISTGAKFAAVPGIRFNEITGYYLAGYAGYRRDEAKRVSSASGGIVAGILEYLLASQEVNSVICVRSTGREEKLFEYAGLSTPEEIRKSRGSAYYPVEMSEVLQQILMSEKTVAVVGVPCFLRALGKARQNLPALDGRIKYLIGLVCNRELRTAYIDYIRRKMKLRGEIQSISFRVKNPLRDSNDPSIRIKTDQREDVSFAAKTHGFLSLAFQSPFFSNRACEFCDDVFAEEADLTAMDAWLPQYQRDWRGTNFLITRNPAMEQILARCVREKDFFLEPVPVEEVMASQRGLIHRKKFRAQKRKWVTQSRGKPAGFIRRASKRPSFKEFLSIKMEDFFYASSGRHGPSAVLLKFYLFYKKITRLFPADLRKNHP